MEGKENDSEATRQPPLNARLYIAAHLPFGSAHARGASIGLVLTLVYENTRKLYYPIALHALAGDAPLLLLGRS